MPDVIDIRTGKPVEQKKKTDNRKKPSFKKIVGIVGALLFLVIWIFVFVQQEQTLRDQEMQKAYLEDIRRSKEESIAAKKEQLNIQASNDFVEEVAREKLHYIKKNEIVFLPVE